LIQTELQDILNIKQNTIQNKQLIPLQISNTIILNESFSKIQATSSDLSMNLTLQLLTTYPEFLLLIKFFTFMHCLY
jgi:hypothetical protein